MSDVSSSNTTTGRELLIELPMLIPTRYNVRRISPIIMFAVVLNRPVIDVSIQYRICCAKISAVLSCDRSHEPD